MKTVVLGFLLFLCYAIGFMTMYGLLAAENKDHWHYSDWLLKVAAVFWPITLCGVIVFLFGQFVWMEFVRDFI